MCMLCPLQILASYIYFWCVLVSSNKKWMKIRHVKYFLKRAARVPVPHLFMMTHICNSSLRRAMVCKQPHPQTASDIPSQSGCVLLQATIPTAPHVTLKNMTLHAPFENMPTLKICSFMPPLKNMALHVPFENMPTLKICSFMPPLKNMTLHAPFENMPTLKICPFMPPLKNMALHVPFKNMASHPLYKYAPFENTASYPLYKYVPSSPIENSPSQPL